MAVLGKPFCSDSRKEINSFFGFEPVAALILMKSFSPPSGTGVRHKMTAQTSPIRYWYKNCRGTSASINSTPITDFGDAFKDVFRF